MVARTAVLTSAFLEDLEWWVEADPRAAARILRLVQECLREPTKGIGKPERLRNVLGDNIWSRRVTQEHRLVYEVVSDEVRFLQSRYHY